MSPVARVVLCAMFVAALLGLPSTSAGADVQAANAALERAIAAVERGSFDEAVDGLELLADQGFVHADASVARGYAYVERARSRAAHPGDLGRAVAALEEARLLGRDEDSIESALERIRSEIARRRVRQASSEVVQRPRLGRAVVALASESVWALVAALGSALLTLGLFAKSFVRRRGAELAGGIGIVTGLVLLVLCGSLAAAARHYRTSSRPAVVVVSEARWLTETGSPMPVGKGQSGAVPEGALVYVREERDGLYRVEWGALEGWVSAGQLRLLARPSEGSASP